jgi:hypothetical protein
LGGILHDAAIQGKAVITFMHHGAMQHFLRQDVYRDWMATADHERLARTLALSGAKVIFTGHGHAQDVTVERSKDGNGGFLYDVETGSLVQYPNPYRIVDMTPDGKLTIRSSFIDRSPGHPEDFRAYSESRLREGIEAQLLPILGALLVSKDSAKLIASQGVQGGVEFFRGDEPGHAPELDTKGMDVWGGFIAGFLGQVLADVGTDLTPVDNDITIDLSTGGWAE